MTRPVCIDIPHALGVAEARRRVDTQFGKLEAQLAGVGVSGIEKRWEGDKLHFAGRALGQAVGGRLLVLADSLRVELDLPPMLAMLAGRIQEALGRSGRLLLEKK